MIAMLTRRRNQTPIGLDIGTASVRAVQLTRVGQPAGLGYVFVGFEKYPALGTTQSWQPVHQIAAARAARRRAWGLRYHAAHSDAPAAKSEAGAPFRT